MTDLVLTLLLLPIAIIILVAVLAPFETLRWWGGLALEHTEKAFKAAPKTRNNTLFVVYLSGIGSVSGNELVPSEVPFLTSLRDTNPDITLLMDVFPYSVTNNGLTGQRLMARLFRWASRRRERRDSVTDFLINIRNALQVAVSADHRYGPVFNFATAHVVRDKLLEHGYPIGSGDRVSLIGYSGGAQIAIGATPFLEALLGAPIRVISLGGFMTGDDGIDDTEHLYHLYSDIDDLQKIGSIVFPGRWPVFTNSGWNIALRTGKLSLVFLEGRTHTESKSYMDPHTLQSDGRSNMDITAELIADFIRRDGLGAGDAGILSGPQLVDLVRRLERADAAAAATFVALMEESGLMQPAALARAALARPIEALPPATLPASPETPA